MFFDKTYDKDNEEAYTSYYESYYNNRSHQDNTKQFCKVCGTDRNFIFDRCEVCKSN